MKPTYEELKHTAVEMSQQDWNDLRFADVYYDAFVAGGKWFMQRYEQLEQQRNELAAQVEMVRSVVDEYHSENIACEEAMNELVFMLNRPESAVLAALKAQWQEETIDLCEKEMSESITTMFRPHVAKVFAVIRQRAQEAGE